MFVLAWLAPRRSVAHRECAGLLPLATVRECHTPRVAWSMQASTAGLDGQSSRTSLISEDQVGVRVSRGADLFPMKGKRMGVLRRYDGVDPDTDIS